MTTVNNESKIRSNYLQIEKQNTEVKKRKSQKENNGKESESTRGREAGCIKRRPKMVLGSRRPVRTYLLFMD